MSNTTKNNLSYFAQLDGIRCFAVISVIIGHWVAWDTENIILKNTPWGHGVILFFVLSGYLISNILFESKEKILINQISFIHSLKIFYTRRFLRIFPAYYMLLFYLFYINHANTREIFPWLMTFSSNILQCKTGNYIGDFNHFWSLAVEEQFYILWPFVILLSNQKHVFKIILAFLALAFLSRSISFFVFKDNWMISSYFTLNQFFPLCLGAFLAYVKRYNLYWKKIFENKIAWLIALLSYSGFFYLAKYNLNSSFLFGIFDEYLFSIVCAFIIYKASGNGFRFLIGYLLHHEIVVFIGKISYGLYLYHLFVIGFFWNYISPNFGVSISDKHMVWLLYFITLFLITLFSYYFIEKPANCLKRFFKY